MRVDFSTASPLEPCDRHTGSNFIYFLLTTKNYLRTYLPESFIHEASYSQVVLLCVSVPNEAVDEPHVQLAFHQIY